MLRNLLATLILLLIFGGSIAQSFSIKGIIADTNTNSSLKNAVVSLLRDKDSVLSRFGRVGENGHFQLQNIKQGKYVVLITHPGFADYADVITIDKDIDMGSINMLTRAMILQDVIVRGSPIRMKGDTLAYMADSFKVKEGSTVEDLLKKLPGIQVNSKGEITAQGERVEKVLVDGEEFFGDDPTLATQNLIAKSVKEVQVFDKKSDQAAFTGVDDGQKSKTINLKLKDEYKKGYFGKMQLAGGLKDSWENSAMINRFNDKQKVSVYGKMSNTKEIGLGWGGESQYGGGIGMEMNVMDDGGVNISTTGDEFGGIGSYQGEGLPKSWMAGASFSNKWNEDKSNVNGAYRYQKLNTEGTTTTNTQTILPDTQFFNNEMAQSRATRWRNRANLKSELKIDSLQALTITADGSYGQSQSYRLINSEALTSAKLPVNRNERTTSSDATNGSFNANILYKKKFKKKGRTFSLNIAERYNKTDNDGFLLSKLELYSDGNYLRTDTIDQKKQTNNNSIKIEGRATYTEPIGKTGIVEISYGYNVSNSEQKLLSYDANNGKYETLNPLYSNDYRFNTGTQVGGVAYKYNSKKIVAGLGTDASFSTWKQTDIFRDTVRNYKFNNFFPRANFRYKLGQYSFIRLNYNGSTKAPGINQIQPVANNADPLNIAIGNPNLKQSFTNRFELGYNFYQVLKEQGVYMFADFVPESNSFSTKDFVDSLGRRIYQTVNVNGNYNVNAYIGYNFKWKKPELQVRFGMNPSFSKNKNFVNGLENVTTNRVIGFETWVYKFKEKKYFTQLSLNGSYTYSKSSIRPDVLTEYWTFSPSADMNVTLPKGFEVNTQVNYNWRQETDVFSNNNALIWDAGFTKKIMKKQDMKVGFQVHDLLNQNIGFQRSTDGNRITERTYNIVKRYWLLTFSWNFNKGPKKDEGW